MTPCLATSGAPLYGSLTLADDGTIIAGSNCKRVFALRPDGVLKVGTRRVDDHRHRIECYSMLSHRDPHPGPWHVASSCPRPLTPTPTPSSHGIPP